jgi:hypothetical protein
MTGDNASGKPERIEPLDWSVCLWQREPGKRYIVLLAAFLSAALGWIIFNQMILMAFVGFFAIMGSTAEYWIPLKFHLDDKVARVKCGISTTEIEWSAIKRVIEGDGGVKLSPLAQATRLAAFRGVFLRYSDNREIVIEYISKYGGDSARLLEQRTDGSRD